MTEVKKELTKDLLALSFKELIMKMPFEKITVKMITDGADVIRPTFYKHFQDKYEIIEYILKKEIKDLSQTLLINKEIIQKFIQNSSIDDKSQFMIEQQKKELSLLIETKENLQKNNKEYQNRNNQLNCIKESLQQENIILNNIPY